MIDDDRVCRDFRKNMIMVQRISLNWVHDESFNLSSILIDLLNQQKKIKTKSMSECTRTSSFWLRTSVPLLEIQNIAHQTHLATNRKCPHHELYFLNARSHHHIILFGEAFLVFFLGLPCCCCRQHRPHCYCNCHRCFVWIEWIVLIVKYPRW